MPVIVKRIIQSLPGSWYYYCKKIHTQNKYCNKHQCLFNIINTIIPWFFKRTTDYLLADCPIFRYGKTIDTFCTSRLRKIEGSQADGQPCSPFGAYPFSWFIWNLSRPGYWHKERTTIVTGTWCNNLAASILLVQRTSHYQTMAGPGTWT